MTDFLLALSHDGQGRRLHTTHRCLEKTTILAVECCHGTRAVDANQPVRFGAGSRGSLQRLDRIIGAQRRKSIADRGLRHRLQPQALHGLVDPSILLDVAKDQLAFPPSVAGIDQAVHVLALDEAHQHFESLTSLFIRRAKLELGWNHRQVSKTPLALDGIIRCNQPEQMANA